MITSPSLSAARDRVFGQQPGAAFLHPVPPSDPARQAQRLPIKVLKMLTARSGHILHPEYLQPLPSTPVSPIELDAKKSPLALLAQTCSQIGKPDPSPSSKLSSSSSCGDKDKAGPLKLSDIGAEDKSSFKPYNKQSEGGKKEASSGDKAGFRVPSAACPPFTPRTGSPSSLPSHSPLPADSKAGEAERKEAEAKESPGPHGRLETEGSGKGLCSESPRGTPTSSASSVSALGGGGLVAPVSPYKPGQSVFPLPPASLGYAGSLASAYGGYSPQFLQQHGLEHAKAGLGCGKGAGSSPLARASPPAALMTASLCRDPYCLSYHCGGGGGGGGGAGGGAPPEPLKAYPFMYGAAPPPLGLHPQHPLSGHPLYPYGFMLPNEPQPHACNWVSASGPCDKRFPSSEELLAHLRTHTAFSGADKLLASYPGSSSSLAAAMACHMHLPPSGGSHSPLALRSPHHHAAAAAAAAAAYGLSSRYHPYSKSPLQPGAPLPLPASAQGHYYSPYALYGQRLTTASALGYQ
ncbi:zinc finger protein 503 [Lissotriton helveticus]